MTVLATIALTLWVVAAVIGGLLAYEYIPTLPHETPGRPLGQAILIYLLIFTVAAPLALAAVAIYRLTLTTDQVNAACSSSLESVSPSP